MAFLFWKCFMQRDGVWRAVWKVAVDGLLGLSAAIGWITQVADVGKQHGAAIVSSYTVAVFVVILARAVIRVRVPSVDFGLRPPRPSRSGPPSLTAHLGRLWGLVHADPTQEVRVTLFVPDSRNVELVQFARYRWDGDTSVSATRIRIGTCAVGHAFNRQQMWSVPNVETFGGFERALVSCGLTPDEAKAQTLNNRGCFAAAPLFGQTDGQRQAVAVVALDARTPAALPPNLEAIVRSCEQSLVEALGLRYVTPDSDAESLDEATARSQRLLEPPKEDVEQDS